MKKLLGYFLVMIVGFGLGSLIQEVKIRRLKKKFKALNTEEQKAMEIAAREKQILAMQEKVKETEDEIGKYRKLADELTEIAEGDSDYEYRINAVLTKFMEDNNIPKPLGDRDFDEFMRDPNAKLHFG